MTPGEQVRLGGKVGAERHGIRDLREVVAHRLSPSRRAGIIPGL
jgi:hypothetical protein